MTTTKTVKQAAAQGDVLFRRVTKIPDGFVAVERKGALVVAHSETGHHHVIEIPGVTMHERADSPLVAYLKMGDDVRAFDVVHQRPWDTHDTLRCVGKPGDVWELRRQREHTPEGWRRVQD
jgi:hypothetical protein